jgi:hypothetical protein
MSCVLVMLMAIGGAITTPPFISKRNKVTRKLIESVTT